MTKGLQLTLWPSKQIACVGATPGTVYTPLSSPLIPGWLWLIVLPLMALVGDRLAALSIGTKLLTRSD